MTKNLQALPTDVNNILPSKSGSSHAAPVADNETYIHLDIKIYVRRKLVSGFGKDVDTSDQTAMTNNFFHSLFSQYNVAINGVKITQASDHYNYRSYLETLLTYGTDAAATHLMNAYWYRDTGDILLCDPAAESVTAATNLGFTTRWDRLSASKEIQLFRRLQSDLFNVPIFLLPGVSLQTRLKKARPSFYMMSKATDSNITFKFFGLPIIGQMRKT